jgi:hypothetical protein
MKPCICGRCSECYDRERLKWARYYAAKDAQKRDSRVASSSRTGV